jgi:hypothetical protein
VNLIGTDLRQTSLTCWTGCQLAAASWSPSSPREAPDGLIDAATRHVADAWPSEIQVYDGGQPHLSVAGRGGVMNTMDTPLRRVVGDKAAKAPATHLDMQTVGDLLYHFPRRYDERGEYTDLASLAVGEQATLLAEVLRRTCA